MDILYFPDNCRNFSEPSFATTELVATYQGSLLTFLDNPEEHLNMKLSPEILEAFKQEKATTQSDSGIMFAVYRAYK